MIDEMTRDQLRVATDGIAGPYLMVPLAQLAPIRAVLDRHASPLLGRLRRNLAGRQAGDRGD